MNKSYNKNYLKIYFWQGVSLLLNFFSMFVVLPYLSSDPITYGVYSVCISFAIFLAYADLGFLSAGQKYAAEYFAQGNINQEIKIIGFTSFILFIFLFIFSFGFYLLSQQPNILLSGIQSKYHINIASSLFMILSFFTPVTLAQRVVQMIYSIRMEDYLVQRISIIGNVLKIFSALWYFRQNNYDIVGFYLFAQFVSLFSVILTFILAKYRYSYNLYLLFKSIRFEKAIYVKTRKLAFTSLFLTVSWILYYELDSLFIGKIFGAKMVGMYAIGLTVLSLFRSVFGILFSPFNIRFNHLIGLKDDDSLKIFYTKVVVIFAPIVIIPIVIVGVFAKQLVFSWVGSNYLSSVVIVRILVFCNIFAFINYPTNFMLIAKERQKELYTINSIILIVFFGGVFITINNLGVLSFALFKLLAFIISSFSLYRHMVKYLDLVLIRNINKTFLSMIWTVLFILLSSIVVRDTLPLEKSKLNLLIVLLTVFSVMLIAFLIHFLTVTFWRRKVLEIIKNI